MAFKLGMKVDMNILMVNLMTLMQGHSGSADEKIQLETIWTLEASNIDY